MNNLNYYLYRLASSEHLCVVNGRVEPDINPYSNKFSTDLKTASVMLLYLMGHENELRREHMNFLSGIGSLYRSWMQTAPTQDESGERLLSFIDAKVQQVLQDSSQVASANSEHDIPTFTYENAPLVLEYIRRNREKITEKDVEQLRKVQAIYERYIKKSNNEALEAAALPLYSYLGELITELSMQDAFDEFEYVPHNSFSLKDAAQIRCEVERQEATMGPNELDQVRACRVEFMELVSRASKGDDVTDAIVLINYLDSLLQRFTPVKQRIEHVQYPAAHTHGGMMPDSARKGYCCIKLHEVVLCREYFLGIPIEIDRTNVLKLAVLADDYYQKHEKYRALKLDCFVKLREFLPHVNPAYLPAVLECCKGLFKERAQITISSEGKIAVETIPIPEEEAIRHLNRLHTMAAFTLTLTAFRIPQEEFIQLQQHFSHARVESARVERSQQTLNNPYFAQYQ